MSEHVQVTRDGHVATIRLHRPEKKNALSIAMYGALRDAIDSADGDPAVRAIVLTGGGELFTAGNDMIDFVKATAGGDLGPALEFLMRLAAFDKPVVAGVAGIAIGIGATMLLHCDLVYASPTATLRMPFVDLGISPEAAASLLLPALVGPRRAAAMLLLGEEIDAETARAWGLVNAVVPDPVAAAQEAAARLASRPPGALRATRALMRRASRALIEDSMRAEAKVLAERLRSAEAAEAFQAFQQRRKPDAKP